MLTAPLRAPDMMVQKEDMRRKSIASSDVERVPESPRKPMELRLGCGRGLTMRVGGSLRLDEVLRRHEPGRQGLPSELSALLILRQLIDAQQIKKSP